MFSERRGRDKEREGEKESEAVILIGLFLCVILLCDFD